MKITAANLIRWAGLAAMGAGIIFVVIQPIHPLDVLASVTTAQWAIIHSLKTAMCLLGLLGMTGLYARQVKEAGWLGLAGYLLLSLFYALTLRLYLHRSLYLAAVGDRGAEVCGGLPGDRQWAPRRGEPRRPPSGLCAHRVLGMCSAACCLASRRSAPASCRAGRPVCLPSGPWRLFVLALLPHPLDRIFAVPMGFALAWLGYALWSERREQASEPVPGRASPQLRQTAAE